MKDRFLRPRKPFHRGPRAPPISRENRVPRPEDAPNEADRRHQEEPNFPHPKKPPKRPTGHRGNQKKTPRGPRFPRPKQPRKRPTGTTNTNQTRRSPTREADGKPTGGPECPAPRSQLITWPRGTKDCLVPRTCTYPSTKRFGTKASTTSPLSESELLSLPM